MILRSHLWLKLTKDRVFLSLIALTVLSFVAAVLIRDSSIERTPIPFNLGILFSVVNALFATLTIRREPLLAYMFLTATILINGTLYFFFRYLIITQVG